MSPTEPYIICDNLVKIYRVADHDVVALQGLDLVVGDGEILGIVGVSGSGKTTLMNILGGLDRPSAGRLRVGGRDLLKLSNAALDEYRLSTVGFVWQESGRNLMHYLTAAENVEVPLTLAGCDPLTRRRRARQLLSTVGLEPRANHHIAQLSGGEQQRVAIAVALANEPRLLLADEPTGEVDEATAQVIYDTFRDLNRQLGLTTLIVSHDPHLSQHVDRVVAIRDGKIASEQVWRTVTGSEPDRLAATGAEADASRGEGREIHEMTVLDSAGRLQVPKEFLEQYHIQGRVRLELLEDGILIRPVEATGDTRTAETLVSEMEAGRKARGWQRLMNSLLSRLQK
jgi:putative ABC transport system ATP-binding protein